MSKIIYLPLEILEQRYTKMMDYLIIEELLTEQNNEEINFTRIYGKELTGNKIETGAFLDACGTNYFKFDQLMTIMKMFRSGEIENGDVFLFSDLWFPGIEAIKYTATFMKLDIKICGVMHAGSWTDTDYVATMEPWAQWIEKGWFKMFDRIYVGSEFHKWQILNKGRCTENGKIFVTGTVWNTNYIKNYVKDITPTKDREKTIIFPHRLDDEKQSGMLRYIEQFVNAKIIIPKKMNLSKKEYYKLMANSKVMVSFALQENFGQSLFESIALGIVPIVPNTLCYPEMVPLKYRYEDLNECISLINLYLEDPEPCPIEYATKWDDSIPNIIKLTKELL